MASELLPLTIEMLARKRGASVAPPRRVFLGPYGLLGDGVCVARF
ncbi:MAG: hypothetical protein ACPL7D_04265 [Candidatus Sumerlaeaceae bacterium]